MLSRLVMSGLGEAKCTTTPASIRQRLLSAQTPSIHRPFSTRLSPLHQESNERGDGKTLSENKASQTDSKDTNLNTKGESSVYAASWRAVLDSLDLPTRSLDISQTDFSSPRVKTSNAPVDLKSEFEEVWKYRHLRGPAQPAKPSAGRSCDIDGANVDAAKGFRYLNSILGRNNVRFELRLGERYEKPNQTRRRLRSVRHRRRFADAVRQRVQLVSRLETKRLRILN